MALCALWGTKLQFCRSAEAQETAVSEVRGSSNRSFAAGASLTLGWASMGLRALALVWALGSTMDVAQQTYSDPARTVTLDEVDFVAAGTNGALMSAVPPVFRGLSAAGWGGKLLVGGATLYLSGHAVSEGGSQLWEGGQQGDYGRAAYGASMAMLGLAGGRAVFDEFSGTVPYSRLPEWARRDVEFDIGPSVAETGMFRLFRINLADPPRRVLSSYSQQTLKLDGAWKQASWPGEQEGLVYVLRDARSGELLKVGKSETSKFNGRFEPYARAGVRTGRELELDVWSISKEAGRTVEFVEAQVRAHLEGQGHKLPWDNTNRRLGRLGPGVPGVIQSSSAKQGWVWEGENYVLSPLKRKGE